jgi:hypothetical protein
MAGLEPARLSPLPPQDSVSTNSTTSAGPKQYVDSPDDNQAMCGTSFVFGFRHKEFIVTKAVRLR